MTTTWNILIFLIGSIFVTGIVAAAEIDVAKEINRLESHLHKMKPPPELVDSLLQQLDTQCKRNKTFDRASLANASKCMEQHFNETQLISDIKQAVPEGKLDNVFHDMCIKWPKVKGCLSEFFVIIEECWQKGFKVHKAVDESVRFFCGDDNDGARIALFVAEGGIQCLEQHGDDVKTCIESKHDIPDPADGIPQIPTNLNLPSKDEVCEVLQELKECTTIGLRKCKDPTPENLASSMVKFVGRAVQCRLKDNLVVTKSGSDAIIATLASTLVFAFMGQLVL